ncbi:hypothetical protein GQ42DRAFT_173630, partial [Ramicandelaber brevisporus]
FHNAQISNSNNKKTTTKQQSNKTWQSFLFELCFIWYLVFYERDIVKWTKQVIVVSNECVTTAIPWQTRSCCETIVVDRRCQNDDSLMSFARSINDSLSYVQTSFSPPPKKIHDADSTQSREHSKRAKSRE